jgi:hypothetical protein
MPESVSIERLEFVRREMDDGILHVEVLEDAGWKDVWELVLDIGNGSSPCGLRESTEVRVADDWEIVLLSEGSRLVESSCAFWCEPKMLCGNR